MSLEKQAYDAIKAALLTFRLPLAILWWKPTLPGSSASARPRFATLFRAWKKGFIEKIPYKGYRVVEISIDAMEEIFEIRAVLEGLSPGRRRLTSAPRISSKQRSDCASPQALEAKNYPQAGVFNSRFHSLLLERSGNRF